MHPHVQNTMTHVLSSCICLLQCPVLSLCNSLARICYSVLRSAAGTLSHMSPCWSCCFLSVAIPQRLLDPLEFFSLSLAKVTSIWRRYPIPVVCLEIGERAKSKGVHLFCCYLPLCSPLCVCELFSGQDLKWPVKLACSPDSSPFFCTLSGHLNIHNVRCHEWTKIWYQEYSPQI